jgi:hypothetical protein
MVFSRKLYVFLYLLCSRKRKGSGPPEKIWIETTLGYIFSADTEKETYDKLKAVL